MKILYTARRKAEPPVYPVNYGLLYNHMAVTDARKITSSDDWIIPSDVVVNALANYIQPGVINLYNANTIGGKLKETGLTAWNSPNSGATNIYGFNAKGSGSRNHESGLFENIKAWTSFWMSNILGGATAHDFTLFYNSEICAYGYLNHTTHGLPLRLVNPSTSLSHGQTGTYTGNDGKIYRTICINNQEWLADNLAETKLRDGSIISEITDNSQWAHGVNGIQYIATTYTGASSSHNGTIVQEVGQSFVVNYNVEHLRLTISALKVGNPNFKITASIYTTTGGGDLPITKIADSINISNAVVNPVFYFPNINLVSGTKYCVVFTYSNVVLHSASHKLDYGLNVYDNEYPSGKAINRLNGGSWGIAVTGNADYLIQYKILTPALCAYNNDWNNV